MIRFLVLWVLIVAAFAMSAWLPRRFSLLAWLVPVGVGALYLVVWLDERQAADSGDNQPGLVAFVGVVVVVLTAAAAGVGRALRR